MSDTTVPEIPLEIVQAQDYDLEFDYADENEATLPLATGYTAKADFKGNYDDAQPVISLSSAASEIILASTAPNIKLKLTKSKTESLKVKSGVYDLFLIRTSDNTVEMAFKGTWKLIRKVTSLP